jgi:hypothetical protein
MPASTQNYWETFDELDRQRKAALVQHKQAFRELDITAREVRNERSVQAWASYCTAVQSLEASVAELERLVWRLQL